MIIYKDMFSGDELFSDTYPIELVHGCLYKVKGKLTTESTSIDDAVFGGNASAEGGGDDEGCDPSAVSGVNICLANRLVETSMGKKDYMTYIKSYMKRVKGELEKRGESAEEFQKGAQVAVKEILGEFKEYQFFMGEKMDADGMLALLKWDEETPYVYFFKHGLDAEKVANWARNLLEMRKVVGLSFKLQAQEDVKVRIQGRGDPQGEES